MAAEGTTCPLLGKKCIERKCMWYIGVRGYNPNTGAEVDQMGCAVAWLPPLLIENSQVGRQAGAAVESFRNEVVDNAADSRQRLLAMFTNPLLNQAAAVPPELVGEAGS